jgi:hypothetical protein
MSLMKPKLLLFIRFVGNICPERLRVMRSNDFHSFIDPLGFKATNQGIHPPMAAFVHTSFASKIPPGHDPHDIPRKLCPRKLGAMIPVQDQAGMLSLCQSFKQSTWILQFHSSRPVTI